MLSLLSLGLMLFSWDSQGLHTVNMLHVLPLSPLDAEEGCHTGGRETEERRDSSPSGTAGCPAGDPGRASEQGVHNEKSIVATDVFRV